MIATSPNATLNALNAAAMEELTISYTQAVTSQLKGLDGLAEWATFRGVLIRCLVLANLIGRSGAAHALRLRFAQEVVPHVVVAAYTESSLGEGFLTRPFTEAINSFAGKVPHLRATIDAMLPVMRDKAFWVTGIESTEAVVKIQQGITMKLANMSTGGTLGDWIAEQQAKEASGLSAARLETVYRTNVMTALNEGTDAQLSEPEMVDATALWKLVEVHDRRTRGNPSGLYPNAGPHYQMDGFIEAPEHPVWAQIGWPGPAGYNCRRSLYPLGWLTAQRLGFATKDRRLIQQAIDRHNGERWEYIRRGAYPDKGFGAA